MALALVTVLQLNAALLRGEDSSARGTRRLILTGTDGAVMESTTVLLRIVNSFMVQLVMRIRFLLDPLQRAFSDLQLGTYHTAELEYMIVLFPEVS